MAARTAVPDRLVWAVETVDPGPDDHLLEIGCGRGAAVALVCARLRRGTILGIDRSASAISAALRRNAEHVRAGRAVLQRADFEDVDLHDRTFDAVFAVNVNLFWVRSPVRELAKVRTLLRPGGALYLFYEPPGPERAAQVEGILTAAIGDTGFAVGTARSATRTGTPLLCVTARPE